MGQVNTPETYDRDFTESRSRCAYYKTEYTKKGKAYEVCAQTTSYTVDCKKRTAKFAITPKIIDIQTGQIIYANTIQKESQQSWCSDSGQSISSACRSHQVIFHQSHKEGPHDEDSQIQ